MTGTETSHGRTENHGSDAAAIRNRATDKEHERIRLLEARDGPAAASAWVERTLAIYRDAVKSPASHASTAHYRPLFEASISVFEQWLRNGASTRNTNE